MKDSRRGYRRIARGETAPGYWRPFIVFSVAVHASATLAFSQVPVIFEHEAERRARAPVLFVQLVRPAPARNDVPVPRARVRGGMNRDSSSSFENMGPGTKFVKKTPAPALGSLSEIENPVAMPVTDKTLDIPAPAAPYEMDDEGFVPRAADLIVIGDGFAVDPGPGGVVILRGMEKEVVAVFAPDDAGQAPPGPAREPVRPALGNVSSIGLEIVQVREPVFPDLSLNKTAITGAVGTSESEYAIPAPVRDIASGFSDAAAESVNEIQVEPSVKINRPVGGASEEGHVEVAGVVGGEGVTSVVVYINGMARELLVRDGAFSVKAALMEGMNEIRAAVEDASGRRAEDRVAVAFERKDIAVRFSAEGAGSFRLSYRWAPRRAGDGSSPPRENEPVIKDGSTGGVFSVRRAAPGIYTVLVDYDVPRGGAEAVFEAAIYGYDPARRKARSLGPFRLEGKGQLPGVRVLMPEGVFWEDDSWFSGIITDGLSITKYKMPEGVIWKEEQ